MLAVAISAKQQKQLLHSSFLMFLMGFFPYSQPHHPTAMVLILIYMYLTKLVK
jgi:hypothetical protein